LIDKCRPCGLLVLDQGESGEARASAVFTGLSLESDADGPDAALVVGDDERPLAGWDHSTVVVKRIEVAAIGNNPVPEYAPPVSVPLLNVGVGLRVLGRVEGKELRNSICWAIPERVGAWNATGRF
jgi:hypothetical protein